MDEEHVADDDGPRPLSSKDFERRTFSDRERVVVRALAEAVFYEEPSGDRATDAARDVELAERFDWLVPEVDRLVSGTSVRVRVAYRATLLLLSFAPLLACLRFARLGSCSVADRAAILAGLDHHPIGLLRLLLVPWKTALAFVYYEHPAALAETGYDDTCATGAPRRPGILGVVPLASVSSRARARSASRREAA